jgi:hypothetical protein
MEVLLYVDNMWNSPNIKITPIIGEGGEQMLGTSIPQCETLIDFKNCFGPLISWEDCVMTNIYVTKEVEKGGLKGRGEIN